ncbi:MAG: hypothetical protein IPK82_00055 [Polyangiaceae bacterium]|nr:hypothetical protein [Polyangiaceae bacterium]
MTSRHIKKRSDDKQLQLDETHARAEGGAPSSAPSTTAAEDRTATPQARTRERDTDKAKRDFERALLLMRSLVEPLRIARSDPGTLRTYLLIVEYLSALDVAEVTKILARQTQPTESRPVSDEDLTSLSLDDAEKLLMQVGVTRKFLERLASRRFHMTSGDISGTPNRDVLVQKLASLIENERTLQTIERLASGGEANKQRYSDERQDARRLDVTEDTAEHKIAPDGAARRG